MKDQTRSFTDYAHLVIMAATLIIAAVGWSQHLPKADRTYSLTWVDYSPQNSAHALQLDAKQPWPANQTLISMLSYDYGT